MVVERGPDGVYDFDAIVLEPRVCRVGGELVDVAGIPVAVTLQLAAFSDRPVGKLVKDVELNAEGELRRMLGMVAQVTTKNNPKVDEDFLIEHLDYERLAEFSRFVLYPVREKAEAVAKQLKEIDGDGGGNAEAT